MLGERTDSINLLWWPSQNTGAYCVLYLGSKTPPVRAPTERWWRQPQKQLNGPSRPSGPPGWSWFLVCLVVACLPPCTCLHRAAKPVRSNCFVIPVRKKSLVGGHGGGDRGGGEMSLQWNKGRTCSRSRISIHDSTTPQRRQQDVWLRLLPRLTRLQKTAWEYCFSTMFRVRLETVPIAITTDQSKFDIHSNEFYIAEWVRAK